MDDIDADNIYECLLGSRFSGILREVISRSRFGGSDAKPLGFDIGGGAP